MVVPWPAITSPVSVVVETDKVRVPVSLSSETLMLSAVTFNIVSPWVHSKGASMEAFEPETVSSPEHEGSVGSPAVMVESLLLVTEKVKVVSCIWSGEPAGIVTMIVDFESHDQVPRKAFRSPEPPVERVSPPQWTRANAKNDA